MIHRIARRLAAAALTRQWGLLVVVTFLLLACSQSGRSQEAGSTVAPTPTALPCIASGLCTLREAAEAARLRVGVAAAPRDDGWNRLISEEFNALSPEGELVWKVIHPGPEEWDFEAADRTLAFAEEHGMITTVSHFIWDQATAVSGTPDWVKAIKDPVELRRVMRDHLTAVSARYGRKINR